MEKQKVTRSQYICDFDGIMKCVCGFKPIGGNYDFEIDKCIEKVGPQFIEVTLHITINGKQGEWDVDRFKSLPVIVCPRCGTLKVDI